MWLPGLLLIFCTPSSPGSSGIVSTTCGSWPAFRCGPRPMIRLNFWSVPPISTSAAISTESRACISRIHQLVQADRLLALEPRGEIVAKAARTHANRASERPILEMRLCAFNRTEQP
jgi:hypothetical protein